jgi:hypothetical protein
MTMIKPEFYADDDPEKSCDDSRADYPGGRFKRGRYLPARVSARAYLGLQHCRACAFETRRRSAARIAKRLKRSEGATRKKAFSIGLSLDPRA